MDALQELPRATKRKTYGHQKYVTNDYSRQKVVFSIARGLMDFHCVPIRFEGMAVGLTDSSFEWRHLSDNGEWLCHSIDVIQQYFTQMIHATSACMISWKWNAPNSAFSINRASHIPRCTCCWPNGRPPTKEAEWVCSSMRVSMKVIALIYSICSHFYLLAIQTLHWRNCHRC